MKNSIKSKYKQILEILLKTIDERESMNIAKIYFEDRFGIINISDREFPKRFIASFNSDMERFENLEPVQYITGKTFFYDSFYTVNNSVLIPRAETELLVDIGIRKSKQYTKPKIIDIGTGSGCIAISIAKNNRYADVLGIDISLNALEIANRNKLNLNIDNVRFSKVDFLNHNAVKKLEKFDLIVSNPPYIGKDEKNLMSLSTLKHEPEIALFPHGENRNIFYSQIMIFANEHLKRDGIILCEINEFALCEIINLAKKYNYNTKVHNDLQSKPRVIELSKPG